MPTFYNFTENNIVRSFDDVFVPADAFRDGNLWGWGDNINVQIGVNSTAATLSTPVTTLAGGANWKQVSCGRNHTAAIKTDGTLWVWGNNGVVQLGINNTNRRSTPVTTFSGGTNWKQVSCGGYHTAAIKTDGTLWLWGQNTNFQIGNTTNANCSTPVTTFSGGTNWKQVSCGQLHTASIKSDGTLWLWGRNAESQSGNNSFLALSTPVTTFAGGTNWAQVKSGINHTAAIKTDGTLWTWGYNGRCQLGTNATTSASTPVTTFAGGNNWKQVSAGYNHTAAVKTDGTLWIWGNNAQVQLGINSNITTVSTPVTTFAGGTNWKQVSCQLGTLSQFTAAVKTDGTLWTWGYAGVNKLGINSNTGNRSTPVTTFAGGTNWKQVECGYGFAFACTYIDSVI